MIQEDINSVLIRSGVGRFMIHAQELYGDNSHQDADQRDDLRRWAKKLVEYGHAGLTGIR